MGSSLLLDEHITAKYEIKRRIGKGAYGIVWKAVDRKTNQTVAIKKIFDAFLNETDAQRTFREIMFLREFRNHANIVRLLDIHRAANDDDIYLIFEYMETDLHKLISKAGLLRDLHKRFIMYQLLRATFYIHSGNVIHRDQKPSNILVDSACHCKVADFGLARSLSASRPNSGYETDPALTDYVATRWYRAPEILVASQQYTKGVDMWSLGCILAEMLLGRPLFPGSSTVNQVEHIVSAINPPTQSDLKSIDASYGSSLLSRPPSRPRKPLAEMLRGSPPDAIDLVSRLLVVNPHKRLTAAEALNHPYVAKYWRNAREPTLGRTVVPILCDHVQLSAAEYRDKLYELIEEEGHSSSLTNTASHRRHRPSTQPSKPMSRPESGVKVSTPAFPQPSTSTQRTTKGQTPPKVLSRCTLSRQSTSDSIVAPTKPRGHSDPTAPSAPRRHSRTEMSNARVGSSKGHREKNWVPAIVSRPTLS